MTVVVVMMMVGMMMQQWTVTERETATMMRAVGAGARQKEKGWRKYLPTQLVDGRDGRGRARECDRDGPTRGGGMDGYVRR
jgi:hypothetical protein